MPADRPPTAFRRLAPPWTRLRPRRRILPGRRRSTTSRSETPSSRSQPSSTRLSTTSSRSTRASTRWRSALARRSASLEGARRLHSRQRHRHERVADRAHPDRPGLVLAFLSRQEQISRRPAEGEDMEVFRTLRALPEKETSGAQLEPSELSDLNLEPALASGDGSR